MAHTGLERRINNISKATGGGRVTIELPRYNDGDFFARVYPTADRARAILAETLRGSLSLNEVQEAVERTMSTQLEYGRGPTVEEAVSDLAARVKAKLAAA